jgi:hypothetical protein
MQQPPARSESQPEAAEQAALRGHEARGLADGQARILMVVRRFRNFNARQLSPSQLHAPESSR